MTTWSSDLFPLLTMCQVYIKVRIKFSTSGCLLFFLLKFCFVHFDFVGRDSVVGIATRYGLDGPGIESR
jgi:hypothetical protein